MIYFEAFGIQFAIDWLQILILTLVLLIAMFLGYMAGYDSGKKDTDESWHAYYRSGKDHPVDHYESHND